MKKIFKKSTAVFLVVLMLVSVMSVSAFAATYKITYNPGNNAIEKNDSSKIFTENVESGASYTLPEAKYTREGYTQIGWCTNKYGNVKVTASQFVGYCGAAYKPTKTVTLYPCWQIEEYDVIFAIDEDAVAGATPTKVEYNKAVNFPAVFTRDGFLQTGWVSHTYRNGVEVATNTYTKTTGKTEKITGDTVFLPVWTKADFTLELSATSIKFGSFCEGYGSADSEQARPEAQSVTITNMGNMTLTYTLPSSADFDVKLVSGNLQLAPGKSLTVSFQPKVGLEPEYYAEEMAFKCNFEQAEVCILLSFTVTEHSFDKYYSDNNATYEADGTKSASCSNGCGTKATLPDVGSMKVYSAANNTVEGLLDEYLYHKTIRATAYGSGTDNVAEDGSINEGTKRYLPVSWYVNDEFNGEFADDDFTINFVHTSFGKYNLKVNYVEQEYINGEWVATGNTDEKSFDYYVGPSAQEEQEVILPNTILSIIFGLFSTIVDLFSSLFG